MLQRELGLNDLRLNAPANNNTATFGMLAQAGATDVEPGTGILGGSLAHVHRDLPELPAQVFVSEIMHTWDGEVYALGGGATYLETYGGRLTEPHSCVVGSSLDQARGSRFQLTEKGVIDYHLVCSGSGPARVGDTPVFALHPQYYVNRCYVDVVSGISVGDTYVEGVFDCAGNALDDSFMPVPPVVVTEELDEFVVTRGGVVRQ